MSDEFAYLEGMTNEERVYHVSYLSCEEYDMLEEMLVYARVRRLEEMASVHWPQYNWKTMRSLFMDAFMDVAIACGDSGVMSDPYNNTMEWWAEHVRDFLSQPNSEATQRQMASISSGDFVRQTIKVHEREQARSAERKRQEEAFMLGNLQPQRTVFRNGRFLDSDNDETDEEKDEE